MFAEVRLRSGAGYGTVTVLRNVSGLTFDEKYNDIGAISLTLPLADANALGVDANSVVEVCPDGGIYQNMWFGLDGITGTQTTDSGTTITFSGKSLVNWLSDGSVFPSTFFSPITNPEKFAPPVVQGSTTIWTPLAPTGVGTSVVQGHAFEDATPGNVLRTLIARCKERGILTWLDETNFTGTNTSSGSTWSSTLTFTYNNGTTLLAVLQDLVARQLIDFRLVGTQLQVFNYGTMSTQFTADQITLRRGLQITEQTRNKDASTAMSDLLVQGDETVLKLATDSSLATNIGRRREGFITQSGITDGPTLQTLALSQLSISGHIQIEDTLGISDNDIKPWTNFKAGDWVWVDFDGTLKNIQIRQIAASQQDGNYLLLGLTLGDLIQDADQRLQQRINNMVGGADARGGLPNQKDFKGPSDPSSVIASPTPYRDSNGLDSSLVVVTWAAPVTNVDGTALNDLNRYEIQYKLGAATTWSSLGAIPATQTPLAAYISNLPVGQSFVCQVRAVDNDGNASNWVTQANTISALPKMVVVPPTPSTPTATSGIKSAVFLWDGLDNTGTAYDPSWDYTELYVSTASGFIPSASTRVGTFNTPNSTITVGSLNESSVYYAKLIAVDKSGNRSNTSAQSTGVQPTTISTTIAPNSITDSMIAAATITGAKIASGTITDQNISPNSITTNSLNVTNFGDSVFPNGGFNDATTQPLQDTTGAAGWKFVPQYPGATQPSALTYITTGGASSSSGLTSLRVSTPAVNSPDTLGWAIGSTQAIPTAVGDVWFVTFKVWANLKVAGGLTVVASLGDTAVESQSLSHTTHGTNVAAGLVDPDGLLPAGTTALDVPLNASGFHQYEVAFTVPAGTFAYKWVTLFIAMQPQGSPLSGSSVPLSNLIYIDDISMRPVGGSATITKLTAAKITSGVLQASSTILAGGDGTPGNYARVEMSKNGFVSYDVNNNQTFKASGSDGSVIMSGTLQVPSVALFANNNYAGQTTINEQGLVQTIRQTNNMAISPGPDFSTGYSAVPETSSTIYGLGRGTWAINANSAVTGGTFKIGFLGVFSAALPYNATAASVQTALNGLSSVAALGSNVFVVVDQIGKTATNSGIGVNAKGYSIYPNQTGPLATRYNFPPTIDGALLTGATYNPTNTYWVVAWNYSVTTNTKQGILPAMMGNDAIKGSTGVGIDDAFDVGTRFASKPLIWGNAGRLFNFKLLQYWDNTAIGSINIPLSYFAAGSYSDPKSTLAALKTGFGSIDTPDGTPGLLAPNTTYVVSWHMIWEQTAQRPSSGSQSGWAYAYLDTSKVKVVLRNYAKTTTSTLQTGINGLVNHVSRDTDDPYPATISRTYKNSTSSYQTVPFIGKIDVATGNIQTSDANGNTLNPYPGGYPTDSLWKRFYTVFTTPASLNDGDNVELQLPTAVAPDGTFSQAGGFSVNGIQLEVAGALSANTTPSRYIDYLEPGVSQNDLGVSFRYAASDVAIPTYAETTFYSRTVLSDINARQIEVGQNWGPRSDLTVNSHLSVKGVIDSPWTRGRWIYPARAGKFGMGTDFAFRTRQINTQMASLYGQYYPSAGLTYTEPRFRKDSRGIVWLEGMLQGTNPVLANNTPLFQLPDEYCPDKRMRMPIIVETSDAAYLDIYPSGEVMFQVPVGGGTLSYISLCGVHFFSDYDLDTTQWTNVGDSGAPAYQNGWTSYSGAAGWSFGARFYRDETGFVHLGGMIQGGTSSGGSTGNVFTLPDGYRPDNTLVFSQPALGNTVRVDVMGTGEVRVVILNSGGGTTASNAWVSLDGIMFMANNAPSGNGDYYYIPSDWIEFPAFLNSWQNYGSAYAPARVYRDDAGVCHLQGLIKLGTEDSPIAATLPDLYVPSLTHIFTSFASGGNARVQVNSSGTFTIQDYAVGASNAYVSLSQAHWWPSV